jgi:hypothetical protein
MVVPVTSAPLPACTHKERIMSAAHPSPASRQSLRRLVDTVRWAPAPVWGESGGEHTRFTAYLAGSMLAWAVGGLAMAALIGTALRLVV